MAIKCPHCMYEIPDGATVCGHCGAYSQSIDQYGKKGCITMPIALFVGGGVGALAAMLLALLLFVVGQSDAGFAIMFFGIPLLGLAGAGVALKIAPHRKETVWRRQRPR